LLAQQTKESARRKIVILRLEETMLNITREQEEKFKVWQKKFEDNLDFMLQIIKMTEEACAINGTKVNRISNELENLKNGISYLYVYSGDGLIFHGKKVSTTFELGYVIGSCCEKIETFLSCTDYLEYKIKNLCEDAEKELLDIFYPENSSYLLGK